MMTPAQLGLKLIDYAGVAAAVFFIALFAYIAFPALFYPFQIEWIEGQSVDVIHRVWQGLPVYNKPSTDYVSLLYTPLFYYVSAMMANLTGMDFIAGRSVSMLATLGIASVFWRWIKQEGGHWQSALIAMGLFFATYIISGRWFDLARVDSLALYLLMEGLFQLHKRYCTKSAALAGVLLGAAYFTKQTMLPIALPMIILAIILQQWRGVIAAAACLLLLIIGSAYLEWASDGWFSFFTLRIPMNHNEDETKWLSFWTHDLWKQQGAVLLVACLFPLYDLIRKRRREALYYSVLLITAIIVIFTTRLHRYGYVNNLMPLHAILALLAGLMLARLSGSARTVAIVVLLGQFYMLHYEPARFRPTADAIQKGHAFLKEIARYDGKIFMPDIQYIATRVGKDSPSYSMGAYDLFRAKLSGDDAKVKAELGRQLSEAIGKKEFSMIIPGRLVHYALPNLNRHYKKIKTLDYPEGFALDSLHNRRVNIYVPR